jgi:hypothetical protein
MNRRSTTAGKTRTCPHCRATILESASVCPACRHHLRFDPQAATHPRTTEVPLKVEGTLQPPADSESWEYCVIVTVRDEHGAELTRKVVDVGAIDPGHPRKFSLAVEVSMPSDGNDPGR